MNPTDLSIVYGAQTLSEILSQPQCWNTVLRKLASSMEFQAAVKMARPGAEWIFVGCGTSYYLAMAAASAFHHVGLSARALPGSEILLYPDLSLPSGRDYIPIVISRSGRTSESVRAAHVLEQERDLRTIAITCGDRQHSKRSAALR